MFTPISSPKTGLVVLGRRIAAIGPRLHESDTHVVVLNVALLARSAQPTAERKAVFDQYGSDGLRDGAPNANNGFTDGWQFHGDSKAVFRAFFGGDNPFADLFPPTDEFGALPLTEPRTRKKQDPALEVNSYLELLGSSSLLASLACLFGCLLPWGFSSASCVLIRQLQRRNRCSSQWKKHTSGVSKR